jgi:hypothetical protein
VQLSSCLLAILDPQINMLIRIRSNLGTWKVAVGGFFFEFMFCHWYLIHTRTFLFFSANSDITIKDLKSQIFGDFKFSTNVTPEKLDLSAQMSGEGKMLESSDTLRHLDIKHGALIYITSKLKHIVIEKSFVSEDGI